MHHIRSGLFQGQGQAAQALGHVLCGGLVSLAGALEQERNRGIEAELVHVLRDRIWPGLRPRGHDDLACGVHWQVVLERARLSGIVEDQQDALALREILAHLPHHLSLIGHHRHTQLGREINVVAGQGRGLFCVQPPGAVVFADMAKGVFERQLGFAHPTQALDGLGERGGLSRGQGLVQLGQGLIAAGEIGVALLGDVPDGRQAAWEARARRQGSTVRERRLDLGARVFPVPLLDLGEDLFPRLDFGHTHQVHIRARAQQPVQVALCDAQRDQLFFDQRSLPLLAAPSGIKVGRRQ